MSQDTQGYVNLDYIASDVIVDREEDDRRYEKILHLAIKGYRALNLNILPSVKVAYLTVRENNTVAFPMDYLDYVLVGIKSGGRIWTLTRNRNILLPAAEECGEWARDNITTNTNDIGQVSGILDGYTYSDHNYRGNVVAGAYALGGGFNSGYYRIDLTNRQIVLLTETSYEGSEIVLEYTSSGINANTVIPAIAIEALTAYIHWKLALHSKTDPMNKALLHQSEWYTQKGMLFTQANAFTVDEFLDAKYLHLSRGVKR